MYVIFFLRKYIQKYLVKGQYICNFLLEKNNMYV